MRQNIMVARVCGRRGCSSHDSWEAERETERGGKKKQKGQGQDLPFKGMPPVTYLF
jgi:hypothetical protein